MHSKDFTFEAKSQSSDNISLSFMNQSEIEYVLTKIVPSFSMAHIDNMWHSHKYCFSSFAVCCVWNLRYGNFHCSELWTLSYLLQGEFREQRHECTIRDLPERLSFRIFVFSTSHFAFYH